MKKYDVKYRPDPEYKFWLYAPEGNGVQYFRSQEERDAAGAEAVKEYLDLDGWSDDVVDVSAGEVTHLSTAVDVQERPPECESYDYGYDEYGRTCNYALVPLPPVDEQAEK